MPKAKLPEQPVKTINRNRLLIGAFIILSFVMGWVLGYQDAQTSKIGSTPIAIERNLQKNGADFSIFWRAWDLLVEKFDGEVNYRQMIYGAIKGMTEALGDPYTSFLTPDEANQLQNDLSGVIYGIGAEIGLKDDKITIISPIADSPAARAGVQKGDMINKINDEATNGMELDIAVSKIRGDEGTKVRLEIIRNGEIKNFEITRERIEVKSVKGEIKEGNIGYVQITRFDEKTTDLLRSKLDEFVAHNVKKVVLDLRGNPGGYLDQSITVTSQFLAEGIVVTEKMDANISKDKYDYKATGNGKMTASDVKIVILIDEGTASAAEIVAGALRDHNRATLVGVTTFGKGSVQEIDNLSGGAQMRITIAHWYTPDGKNIGKEGIKPDIEVDLTEEDYNAGRDPQFDKALELLKK
jgi:carboxyl-terminal processing protease